MGKGSQGLTFSCRLHRTAEDGIHLPIQLTPKLTPESLSYGGAPPFLHLYHRI